MQSSKNNLNLSIKEKSSTMAKNTLLNKCKKFTLIELLVLCAMQIM